MINKTPIRADRIRKISGSFGFIEHDFFRKGFFKSLTHQELVFYLFLVLVSDRNGMSYWGYDKICNVVNITVDQYIQCRNWLMDMDLIAFDGTLFQVLSLPPQPVRRRP